MFFSFHITLSLTLIVFAAPGRPAAMGGRAGEGVVRLRLHPVHREVLQVPAHRQPRRRARSEQRRFLLLPRYRRGKRGCLLSVCLSVRMPSCYRGVCSCCGGGVVTASCNHATLALEAFIAIFSQSASDDGGWEFHACSWREQRALFLLFRGKKKKKKTAKYLQRSGIVHTEYIPTGAATGPSTCVRSSNTQKTILCIDTQHSTT